MTGKFERFGFAPQKNTCSDLDLYRKEDVALLAMHKFKADRRASRESANHLDPEMLEEMNSLMADLSRDRSLRSIIIASAQMAAFCRGAKVELLPEATEEQCREIIDSAQALLLKIQQAPQPVIAMVDGFALGGGMEMILGCDYRVSSDRDTVAFGLPEASLGIIPAMGGTLNLRRLTKPENARKILLEARANMTAAETLDLGILDKVVPPENLLEDVFSLAVKPNLEKRALPAREEAAVSPQEVREEIMEYLAAKHMPRTGGRVAPLSKVLLRFLLDKTSIQRFREGLLYEREIFCFLQGTGDCREGIGALTEERIPHFEGK